jgi:2-polyprenyl-3-methyl-5-hydroxy-6-metoxy-1,4-benzoquinol methylase
VFRSSPLLREAKGALKAHLPTAAWRALKRTLSRGPREIALSDLEAEVALVEQAFRRSSDEGVAAASSFELKLDAALPADPWSAAYRDAQMELYRRISGRAAYSTDNERSDFDLQAAIREPYPYLTRSTAAVGDQLIAIGYLIRHLGLAPPAEIVELGAGWGNTTCALARMGFRVTAVDVDPRFLDLLRARTAAFSDRVTLVRSDMLDFRSDHPFDAALFYESFHHCSDHLAMLARLRDVLRGDGRILFASEPIDAFPVPWGVRLDGLSVWSMRRYGWLELGFETSYFFEALRRTGWTGQRHRSHAISTLTDVIVATRAAP